MYTEGVSDILILGNINMKETRSAVSKKYTNTLNILHLNQMVKTPTRVTPNSCTLIDHVLVNRCDMYYQSETLDMGISDHAMIYTARRKLKLPTTFTYIKCRSYTHFDDQLFQQDIERITWTDVLNNYDIESAPSTIHKILCDCVDLHAPIIVLCMVVCLDVDKGFWEPAMLKPWGKLRGGFCGGG